MNDEQSPIGGPLELPPSSEPQKAPRKSRSLKPGKWLKRLLLVLLILAITIGLGFAAGKLFGKRKEKPQAQTQAPSTSTPVAPKTSDIPSVYGTKTFTSSSLGVELTYPTGWTATEVNGGVRIESPEFTYTNSSAMTVSGNFRVYIRKGARDVDSKYIGRGVAVKPSEKLVYASPTSVQRKETNLSFFGLDNADAFAFFLVAGNFTLNKGDTLGPNYGKEADTVLVTGGYSSKDLKDDFATNLVPLATFQDTNAYKQALDILKSLKLQ